MDLSFPSAPKRGFVSLGHASFEDCVIDGLTILQLTGSFVRCSLRGLSASDVPARIDGCDLSMAKLDGFMQSSSATRFSFARLDGCKLTGQRFQACRFDHASLARAELGNTRFEDCDFEGAAFFDAFYSHTRFVRARGLDRERMAETARVIVRPAALDARRHRRRGVISTCPGCRA